MAKIYKVIDGSSGSGGGGSSDAFVFNFTTGMWAGPSNATYIMTILQSTHQKGTAPTVQVYREDSGDFELVEVAVVVNSFGDITITISEFPDNRFPGRAIII